ncbi:hypothetical protein [Rhizobium leguminosarum]|uniref:hypothetical protein n=1 Tax=Rhizobium TaxID=379 RepID=UPI00047739A2|nr:hypothetical protein [Rhizobium leguminosarum]TAV88461.1 hypothetical protein ELI22_04145 [Rhizobium leguminosarum]TAV93040.1 hypothetical protein ELI21_04130 [Rhizobium leguminosarum]TAW34117.1 hypothetical protein ELI23_04170 [Rhizobium leguminosarum]TAX59437.1 hypothetical protein ELI02_05150 [Rhizobium leguminosarum]
MVDGDLIVSWIMFCVVGAFCAYHWYWLIRSIIFYSRNGFDFREDFGPEAYWSDRGGDDDCVLMKPKEKFLIFWPSFVVITSVMLTFIVLGLTGII